MDRSRPVIFVRAAPNANLGEALRIDLAARLRGFRYEDNERRADKCELRIDNYDCTVYDDPAFKKGMQLEVAYGYRGNMKPARRLVVTAIKGGPMVTVTAEALSVLMNTVTRTERYTNVRRSDVVRIVAARNGWEGDAVDIEETPVVYPSIAQARLTDAQLLRRLANQEGFQFYVDGAGLHWHRRRVGTAPVKVLQWFTDQTGTLIDYNVTNDITARPRPGATRVRGRNALDGTDIDVTADDESESDRDALATIREVIDPETGAGRIETSMAASEIVPSSAPDEETARRLASGRFRNHQQRAVKMGISTVPDPGLVSRSVIEIRGLGTRLSQRYYVQKVVDTIGDGWTQTAEVVSDGIGGHSTTSRLASGLELFDPPVTTAANVNTEAPVPGAEGGASPEGSPLSEREEIDPETGAARVRYAPR